MFLSMWLDQRLRQYGGVLPTLALPTHTPLLVLVGRMILAMGIGLFAPPFGVGYYAACAIGRVDPAEGIRWIFDRVPASAYAMGGGR